MMDNTGNSPETGADNQEVELSVDELIEAFRAGKGPKGAAEIVERLDAAESARDDAVAENAKLQAKLDKAAKAAKVSRSDPAAGKPRKIGPISDPLSREALKAAIDGAEKVEIVFSDGDREIKGINPILVEGDAWIDHMLGLKLNEPLEVHGPAHGGAPFVIAGYGLLIDDKLVAYAPRSGAITVNPGNIYKIENDIFF